MILHYHPNIITEDGNHIKLGHHVCRICSKLLLVATTPHAEYYEGKSGLLFAQVDDVDEYITNDLEEHTEPTAYRDFVPCNRENPKTKDTAESLLKEALGFITDKPWDDPTLLHARISEFLGLPINYAADVAIARKKQE